MPDAGACLPRVLRLVSASRARSRRPQTRTRQPCSRTRPTDRSTVPTITHSHAHSTRPSTRTCPPCLWYAPVTRYLYRLAVPAARARPPVLPSRARRTRPSTRFAQPCPPHAPVPQLVASGTWVLAARRPSRYSNEILSECEWQPTKVWRTFRLVVRGGPSAEHHHTHASEWQMVCHGLLVPNRVSLSISS